MKKSFIALCCIAVLWAGCKEKDLPISFGTPVAGTDSTYLGPVPASTDPHNILVEEFTGQDCSNCPKWRATLDGAAAGAGNEGRVNIVSMYLYINGLTQTNPPWGEGAIYDLRDSTASDMIKSIYSGLSQIPGAGMDRTTYTGQTSLALEPTVWADAINQQKNIVDSLNLAVASSYDAGSGLATIKVIVTYTQAVASKQNISVYVVEDSLYDVQADGRVPPPDQYDHHYLFMDVFRAMLSSPPTGDPVLDNMATKPAGQVYWKKYTFKPAGTKILNPAHCRVVAFVDNGGGTAADYRVLQSVQTRLMP